MAKDLNSLPFFNSPEAYPFIVSPHHARYAEQHFTNRHANWPEIIKSFNEDTEVHPTVDRVFTDEEVQVLGLLFIPFHQVMRYGRGIFLTEEQRDSDSSHCFSTLLEMCEKLENAQFKDQAAYKEICKTTLLHDLGEFMGELSINSSMKGGSLTGNRRDKIEHDVGEAVIRQAIQAVREGNELQFIEEFCGSDFASHCNNIYPDSAAIKGHITGLQNEIKNAGLMDAAQAMENWVAAQSAPHSLDEAPLIEKELITLFRQIEASKDGKKATGRAVKSNEKTQGDNHIIAQCLYTPPFLYDKSQESPPLTNFTHASSALIQIIFRNAFRHPQAFLDDVVNNNLQSKAGPSTQDDYRNLLRQEITLNYDRLIEFTEIGPEYVNFDPHLRKEKMGVIDQRYGAGQFPEHAQNIALSEQKTLRKKRNSSLAKTISSAKEGELSTAENLFFPKKLQKKFRPKYDLVALEAEPEIDFYVPRNFGKKNKNSLTKASQNPEDTYLSSGPIYHRNEMKALLMALKDLEAIPDGQFSPLEVASEVKKEQEIFTVDGKEVNFRNMQGDIVDMDNIRELATRYFGAIQTIEHTDLLSKADQTLKSGYAKAIKLQRAKADNEAYLG